VIDSGVKNVKSKWGAIGSPEKPDTLDVSVAMPIDDRWKN